MVRRDLYGRRIRMHAPVRTDMNFDEMKAQMRDGQGFVAALDQSGGSTPKALKGYGVDDTAGTTE